MNFLICKKKIILVGAVLLSLGSCQKNEAYSTSSLSEIESRGKSVYLANCIACHHINPSLAGSIGPVIEGSSLELLTHKVLTRDYPQGYTPKRNSDVMPSFAHLKNDVEALHAYLNLQKK